MPDLDYQFPIACLAFVGRICRALGMTARSCILPNGSVLDRSLPQVLEPQQHGQHPFELAVEMDLVAPEPLQLTEAHARRESRRRMCKGRPRR